VLRGQVEVKAEGSTLAADYEQLGGALDDGAEAGAARRSGLAASRQGLGGLLQDALTVSGVGGAPGEDAGAAPASKEAQQLEDECKQLEQLRQRAEAALKIIMAEEDVDGREY